MYRNKFKELIGQREKKESRKNWFKCIDIHHLKATINGVILVRE